MFKGLFIADLHASRKRLDGCIKVLDTIYMKLKSYKKEERPYFFIAGDFWDATITNTDTMALFVSYMKDIRDLTEVFIIYGTATHDVPCSLDVFEAIGCHIYKMNTFERFDNFELVAIPEPRKTNYISKTKKNKSVVDIINEDLQLFVSTLPEKQLPRICLYHGEIRGCMLNSAKPCSSPVAVSKDYLKSINADFIACGHIHQKQELFENCWYLGTPYQNSFAETHEPSYFIVEIN